MKYILYTAKVTYYNLEDVHNFNAKPNIYTWCLKGVKNAVNETPFNRIHQRKDLYYPVIK